MPDGGMVSLEDVKELFAKQATTFEAFKQANDQRFAEIEKKGKADPILEEKVNKINADLGTSTKDLQEAMAIIQKQVDGLGVRMNRAPAGADEVKALKVQQKHLVEFYSLVRDTALDADHKFTDGDIELFAEYKTALRIYMRRGKGALTPEQAKALSVGDDGMGGAWTLPEYSDEFLVRLFDTSPMRQVARVMSTSNKEINFPEDKDTGISGGWVAETAARPATNTPGTTTKTIPAYEQYAMPEATQTILDDGRFDMEAWLIDKTAEVMGRTENTAFVSGTGSGQPTGFLNYGAAATSQQDSARAWGVLQYVPTGQAAALGNGDELIDIVQSIKAAYRAGSSWLMNRLVLGDIRKMKDGQGNYLWSMGNIIAGQPPTLLGYPTVEAEDMPAVAADAFPVAFGNWRIGYYIVDRIGLRMLRDPYTNKPYIRFYMTKRVGGDMVNSDAIKLLKVAAS